MIVAIIICVVLTIFGMAIKASIHGLQGADLLAKGIHLGNTKLLKNTKYVKYAELGLNTAKNVAVKATLSSLKTVHFIVVQMRNGLACMAGISLILVVLISVVVISATTGFLLLFGEPPEIQNNTVIEEQDTSYYNEFMEGTIDV